MSSRIIKIVLFVCLLTLPWILWYGPGKLGKTVRKTYAYELKENRNIYDLEDGLENAYNDRIPFRSFLITTYQDVNQSLESAYKAGLEQKMISALYHEQPQTETAVSEDDALYEWLMGSSEDAEVCEDHIHDFVLTNAVEPSVEGAGYNEYTCSFCKKTVRREFQDKLIDSAYFPEDITDTLVIKGRNDWLFSFEPRHMLDLYQKTSLLSEQDFANRKETYENLQAVCDERGIKLAFLIAPAKYQVYDEYMPSMDVEAGDKSMDSIANYFEENSDVVVCYPRKELNYADKYYQTYFRYDSHWNQVGGYIGTMCLYRALGLDVTPINSVEIAQDLEEPTECVDLFGMCGSDYNDFDHVDYNYVVDYKPEVTATNTPTVPTYEMDAIQEMTSDVENDLHFVLMGDSFRSQLASFVAKDFSETTFIDRNCIGKEYADAAGLDFEKTIQQLQEDVLDADYLVIELTEANEDLMMNYAIYLLYILSEN